MWGVGCWGLLDDVDVSQPPLRGHLLVHVAFPHALLPQILLAHPLHLPRSYSWSDCQPICQLGLGYGVSGFGFSVSGFGFRVSGLGFRI